MGQSIVKNYIHLVFSTKHRKLFIQPPVEFELHNYQGGICNKLDCQVIKVGGYTDHILVSYPKNTLDKTNGRVKIAFI